MTGMFKAPLNDGQTIIGKVTKEYSPHVKISGVGIANRHCLIEYDQDTRITTVHPNNEDAEKF